MNAILVKPDGIAFQFSKTMDYSTCIPDVTHTCKECALHIVRDNTTIYIIYSLPNFRSSIRFNIYDDVAECT